MGSENEPARLLLPYLQRADELQKHEPLVAYYCRLYAMERGLKIPQKERTKTTNSILISLMNQLEKDKKSVQLGPEDSLYVEGFASNVFAKADKQDRAGRADLNTAKTFYAASIFFEILNQFGELQPELEQRQKYAAWKAADIRKALKEGRRPEPGPPGGEKNMSEPSDEMNNTYDFGSSETLPPPNQNVTVDNSSVQPHAKVNYQPPTNLPTSPPSHPTSDYPSDDYHPPPSPTHRPENFAHPQGPEPYHHQSYPQDPHQPMPPQNYPSHDPPSSSFSYPNFQTYPSFSDHSLPSVPTHFPSFYQGSEGSSFSHQSPPPVSHQPPPPPVSHQPPPPLSHQSPPPPLYHQSPPPSVSHQSPPLSRLPSQSEYSSGTRNPEPVQTSSQTFHYDSNYQPPPDKIAEAHKAARFAVGALAFDDVAIAVDFLRKSLELLTNPSASPQ